MKPIIFIPGIEATALVNANTFNFDVVWNAFDTVGTSLGTKLTGPYMDEKLQFNAKYDEKIESVIERSHIARLPYERAISKLQDYLNNALADELRANGESNVPVFLFGYDWRQSNIMNAQRLDNYVEYLKVKLSGQKLDGFRFITHSMGGLVYGCYLKLLADKGGEAAFNHIDKAVMCAPPLNGSPYALIHMVRGDAGLKSFLNKIFGRDQEMRKIIRTYPALYELLPFYQGALRYEEDNNPIDLQDKSKWQSNIYDDIEPLFDNRLEIWKEFKNQLHIGITEMPERLKNRTIILAGYGDKTTSWVKIKRDYRGTANYVNMDELYDEYNGKQATGDGTVPFESATAYKRVIPTLIIDKENFFDEFSNNVDFHGLFMLDSRVVNIIKRYFGEKDEVITPQQFQDRLQNANVNGWWQSVSSKINITI